jgi:hypothetical protein
MNKLDERRSRRRGRKRRRRRRRRCWRCWRRRKVMMRSVFAEWPRTAGNRDFFVVDMVV